MKIFYIGNNKTRLVQLQKQHAAFLAIGWDKWDDFGYKTYLPCSFYVNGEEVEFDNLRILIEGSGHTAVALDHLIQKGWSGEFPIPHSNYISNPDSTRFYQIVAGKLSIDDAKKVALTLRDASYLKNIQKDERALELIDSEGFEKSLLREAGSIKAFEDGWLLFKAKGVSNIKDFRINLPSIEGPQIEIPFRFNSEVLPYDINILIGPNGVGKSFCLQMLVEYWLKIGHGSPEKIKASNITPFDTYPNLSNLILISYSPFEDFTLDLEETELQDKDVYHYFGFRKKTTVEEKVRITISRNLPVSDSVNSILSCIEEDITFGFIPGWVNKFATAKSVLKEAIDFEDIYLQLKENIQPLDRLRIFQDFENIDEAFFLHQDKTYLKIHEEFLDQLKLENIKNYVELEKGVIFEKNDTLISLSSGQRLFSYIVINILGALKENSLVVVDEPELFLHPNLEIEFISLLKSVLIKFRSKAILATHSIVTAREVPANCTHIMRKTEFGTEVVRPPFETFGGDMQRLTSYVFGDNVISKPYEDWIEEKMKDYESPQDFLNALNSEVNEELIMKIHRIGKRQ